MKWTKTLLLVGLLLFVPMAIAISTTTTVWFNVASVVAYTLSLPGESAVAATLGGAPTTAIEFNTTTGNEADIDAKVVGGTVQSSGTPIFQFDNTGTAKLNISVVLNTATPACMNLTGATTFGAAGAVIGTSPVVVTNNFGKNDAVVDWYMKTDFANCEDVASTSRVLNSTGIKA